MRKLRTLFFTLFMCISACACLTFTACEEKRIQNSGDNQAQIDNNIDENIEKEPSGGEETPPDPEKAPPLGGQPAPEVPNDTQNTPAPELPARPVEGEGEERPNPPAPETPNPSGSEEPVDPEPNLPYDSDPAGPAKPGEPQKHEHDFSEWYYDVDGRHMRYCPCGVKETQQCDMVKKIVPPTCTTDGYTLYTCTVCNGMVRTDVVPSNGDHVWTYTVNYDTDGYSAGGMQHFKTCQNCGLFAGAEKCSFQVVEHVPTCTEDGFNRYTCSVCSNYYDAFTFYVEDGVPKQKRATGHTYAGDWVHTLENGAHLHTRTCEVCGHVEKEDCLFEDTSVSATCTEGGTSAHKCKICNFYEVLSTHAALGHDLTEIAPLLGTEDMHGQYCLREGCTYAINSGCTYNQSTIIQDATCKEKGKKTISCICGRSKEIIIFPSGHKLKKAVSSSSSEHIGYCEQCNELISESHKYTTSNLCTTCGHDGLVYNFRKAIYIEECFQGTTKPNAVNKNAKTIYICENFFAAYGDSYLTYGICKNAFKDNKNLTDIYIPACVQMIDPAAFNGCTALKTIHFQGTQEEWNEIVKNSNNKDASKLEGVTLVCGSYEYPNKLLSYETYNSPTKTTFYKKKEETLN